MSAREHAKIEQHRQRNHGVPRGATEEEVAGSAAAAVAAVEPEPTIEVRALSAKRSVAMAVGTAMRPAYRSVLRNAKERVDIPC